MKTVDRMYQKFMLIQQLETKANECIEQANALRSELEVAFTGIPMENKVIEKVIKLKEGKEKEYKFPNGPQAKVLSFLKANRPNEYTIPELCSALDLGKAQVYNVIYTDRTKNIKRVGRGKYVFNGE